MENLKQSTKYVSMHKKVYLTVLFFFPLKLSGNILDVYCGEQGTSPVNMGLTSASCPNSLPMKREVTGNVALRFYAFYFYELYSRHEGHMLSG